jgi:16S rRNA (guanine(1405)-N(7))-methyltransferase
MSDLTTTFITEVRKSRKYHDLDLPDATLQDLIGQELGRHKSERQALQAARERLHNLVAPYLGDPDYPAALLQLDSAFASSDPQAVQVICTELLNTHASTKERQAYLGEFYAAIFAVTGQPQIILDLACGLNPLAFPWMGLPLTTQYHAYDLHQPRVELINHYFKLQGLAELAVHGDILVNPPKMKADAAFFFKEAHRFEQRRRGCNRDFWLALNVNWLVVTLPASSLTGRHDLAAGHRKLVVETLAGLDWSVIEQQVGNELIFCINKGAG